MRRLLRLCALFLLAGATVLPVSANEITTPDAGIAGALYQQTTGLFPEEDPAEGLLTGEADPEAGLPAEVIELLGDFDAEEDAGFFARFRSLLEKTLANTELLGFREAVRDLGLLLGAALLSALLRTQDGGLLEVPGCLAAAAVCAGGLQSMLGSGTRTVEQIHEYLRQLLPGVGLLMAASGRLSGAGAVTSGALIGFDVLTALLSGLVTPLICFRAGLAVAESAFGLDNLSRLRDLLKSAQNGLLKLVFWMFSGLLSLTDLFSGAADARQLRIMRSTISGMVPGVGGIVSEASQSLLSAASMLKASVGMYGLLAVAALCLAPFLRIWLRYLVLRLAAALGGLLGKGKAVDLMGKMAEILGSVLAAAGTCCILAMLSLTLCVRTVIG